MANRDSARRKVARQEARVCDLRSAHLHRASRSIVDRHGAISMDSPDLAAMAKGLYGSSVGEAGLGTLMRQVAYKALWVGHPVHRLDPFERSTGVCPDCDRVGPKLHPRVRSWTCEECETTHDRDIAAARWIDMVGTGARASVPAG